MRVRRVILSLFTGLILTIVSAWALAMWGSFTGGELVATYSERNTKVPPELVPEGWDPRSWHYWTGVGIRRDLVSECEWMGSTLGMTMDGRPQRTVTHIRVGWPMPAMTWYDYWSDAPKPGGPWLEESWWMGWDVGANPPTYGPGGKRWSVTPRLPLRPWWPGFAINILVFAAGSFVVLSGAAAWRRGLRRRRGLCETCGYALAGLAKCPECGQSGPGRAAA